MADPNKETLVVTVNYALTVEEAVAAGHYNWANDNITSSNFATARTGEHQLKGVLVHFDRVISSEDALAELDKLGLRAGELHELLAVGAQHPDKQRKFPIPALGSEVTLDGYRGVPFLGGWGGRRELGLYWFGVGWLEVYRFLAFRK